jgi:hypothetical protein
MSRAQLMPMAMCASWEDFSREVPGSGGKTYTVTHGYSTGRYQFGYTCTCPASKFQGGECKHIKWVDQNARPCLWHEQFDGGTPENGKCPKCGGPVKSVICAV